MSSFRRRSIVCVVAAALSFPGACLLADKKEDREILFRQLQGAFTEAQRCMAEDRFLEASEILEGLIAQGQGLGFDQRSYLELSMHLAETYAAREMAEESETLLTGLLAMDPPDDLYLRMELLRTRMLADMGDLAAAFKHLWNLEQRIPSTEWASEDRQYFDSMISSVNRRWEDLILRADRLFTSGLFPEAIQVFTEVVEGINSGAYPKATPGTADGREVLAKVRHRLAEAYYLIDNFDGATTVLSNIQARFYKGSSELQNIYMGDLFLLGSAARKVNDFETAERSLKAYLSYDGQAGLPHRDEALLELGLAYLYSDRGAEAGAVFNEMQRNGQKPHYRGLGHIYRARQDLEAGNYQAIEDNLRDAESVIEAEDPLAFEASYLRGEALYQLGDWEGAISAYQAALPSRHTEHAKWQNKTLYNLGWAYVELGDEQERGSIAQAQFFQAGEDVFRDLLAENPEERIYLALARGYFKRAENLEDSSARKMLEELLSDETLFKDPDNALAALLLRASSLQSYELRDTVLRRACAVEFKNTGQYGEAWLARGLNDFAEAQEFQKRYQREEADQLYQESIVSLYNAFDLLRESHRSLAGQALRYQVRAYFHQGSYESKYMALSLTEALLDQHRDVFTAMREQDEVLYYRGLLASHLMPYGESERLAEIAAESLNEVLGHWANGSYAADANNVLGAIYLRQERYAEAEQAFLALARDYPYSEHVGEAWFWAAESATSLHRDGAVVRKYRRKVFDEYPDSLHAAEAYFKYYNYSDYLQGQGQAMAHLHGLKEHFPNTPYLIVADYLVGLDLKGERRAEDGVLVHYADIGAALTAFEEARQHFDFCYEHGLMDNNALEYLVNVRYAAMLERARGLIHTAATAEGAKRDIYLQYGEQAYREIVNDFGDDASPLMAFLHEEIPASGVREEAEYGLAEVQMQAGQLSDANEQLDRMLDRFDQIGHSEGYYPARIWTLKGQIAEAQENHREALSSLERAEQLAGSQQLTSDEILDIWIHQASCHRSLGELDLAMSLLSKVVDEELVSPVRVRAMYQRAEIFELQGRRDLALKQLEATASKGGEWAFKAKERMKRDFGFN